MEKIVFTPSEQDLMGAYGLHIKRFSGKRLTWMLAIGFMIGVGLAAIDDFSDPFTSTITILSMVIWAAIVVAIIQFMIPRYWIPRLARKTYAQQKDLRLETTTWWDDEKLYSSNEQTKAHFEFVDMVKWLANDDTVLIYRSDHLFNFLPTRVFRNNAEMDALIRRLQDAGIIGERKRK
ncbi:MAG: YcxB family protein [Parasphingorhabdus sp.]